MSHTGPSFCRTSSALLPPPPPPGTNPVQHRRALPKLQRMGVDRRARRAHPLHAISQSFERISRRAGVRVIRLHDLRHTHRTLLIAAGVPVKVVSERLGHATPVFTIDTY